MCYWYSSDCEDVAAGVCYWYSSDCEDVAAGMCVIGTTVIVKM